jgi:hypothetical protein
MKITNKNSYANRMKKQTVLALIALMVAAMVIPAALAELTTNQSDYAPTDPVVLTGSGFLPNTQVDLALTGPEGFTPYTWSVMSDENGCFQTTYSGGLMEGTFTLEATDGTNTQITTFTDSSISFSPTSGVVGTSVSVSGTGFSQSTTITIKFDTTTVAQPTSGGPGPNAGKFSTTFNVPSTTVGSHTISASDGSHSASDTFQVTSLTLTPNHGLVGDTIAMSGAGFHASLPNPGGVIQYVHVSATFDGDPLTLDPTSPETSNTGTISGITFEVPDLDPGVYTVVVTDDNNPASGAFSASATFTIDPALVSITITSDPTGSGFVKVDGTAYDTPHTFSWTTDDTHTLQALSPVMQGGYQYFFVDWSDGGAQTHTYTVPDHDETVTADYVTPQELDFEAVQTSGPYTAEYTITANVDLTSVKVQGGLGSKAYNIYVSVDGTPVWSDISLSNLLYPGTGWSLKLDTSKNNNVFTLSIDGMDAGTHHTITITFRWSKGTPHGQSITGPWSAVCTSIYGTLKTPYTDVLVAD